MEIWVFRDMATDLWNKERIANPGLESHITQGLFSRGEGKGIEDQTEKQALSQWGYKHVREAEEGRVLGGLNASK